MAASKPVVQLNATRDVMSAFVETGKISCKQEPLDEPQQEAKPRTHETSVDADMEVLHEARKKRSGTTEMTTRTYEIPKAAAHRLKVISAQEGVNVSEIVADLIVRWVRKYDRVDG